MVDLKQMKLSKIWKKFQVHQKKKKTTINYKQCLYYVRT